MKKVEGHLVFCRHWKDFCHTLVSVGGTQRPAVKLQWATCREELAIDRIADKAFSGIVSSRVDGRFPCKSLLAYSLSAASFVFAHITASSSCDPRGGGVGPQVGTQHTDEVQMSLWHCSQGLFRRTLHRRLGASCANLHSPHVVSPRKKSFPIWLLITSYVIGKRDVFIFLDWLWLQSMNLINGLWLCAAQWYENIYRNASALLRLRAWKVQVVGRTSDERMYVRIGQRDFAKHPHKHPHKHPRTCLGSWTLLRSMLVRA